MLLLAISLLLLIINLSDSTGDYLTSSSIIHFSASNFLASADDIPASANNLSGSTGDYPAFASIINSSAGKFLAPAGDIPASAQGRMQKVLVMGGCSFELG